MQKVHNFPQVDGNLGWLEISPHSTAPLGSTLKGNHEFDVVIIGAGFTGISVALRMAEINPSTRIALVDALRVGEGTSGRNAGFLIDLPHNVKFGETGTDEARALYGLNTFAIERLRELKDRHAIPSWCDAGKYMAAREQKNIPRLDYFEGMLRHAGFEYETVSGTDLAKRLGTEYYLKAIYTPGNVLVNPASLVRGLIKALPASVTLFENSPVHKIAYGQPHKLYVLGGTITAPIVVQATNSFVEEFGKLSNRTVPVFTYASLTQPVPDAVLQQRFRDVVSWGLTSAHLAGTTVRFTDDNRIFIRNMYDVHTNLRSTNHSLDKAWNKHRSSFEARFPFLKEMQFEYTWGGMICMTRNYEPVFKKAGDGVYLLGGCNGVGVVKGAYLGYYMADYITGIKSKNLQFIIDNSKPSLVPPDPFRAMGARMRIAWEASTARGDV